MYKRILHTALHLMRGQILSASAYSFQGVLYMYLLCALVYPITSNLLDMSEPVTGTLLPCHVKTVPNHTSDPSDIHVH